MIFLGFLCFLDHYALIIFAAMQFVWISAKLQMINMPLSSFYVLFMMNQIYMYMYQYASVPRWIYSIPICLRSMYLLNIPHIAYKDMQFKLYLQCNKQFEASFKSLKKTHGFLILKIDHRHASKSKNCIAFCYFMCIHICPSEYEYDSLCI